MRVPLHMISMLHLPILEIGLALFDSYVIVNAFIAWRNHILSGRPEKERSWRKYGIRAARLSLITRQAKRCSRHYPPTQPHKNKEKHACILYVSSDAFLSNLGQSTTTIQFRIQQDRDPTVWSVGKQPHIFAGDARSSYRAVIRSVSLTFEIATQSFMN